MKWFNIPCLILIGYILGYFISKNIYYYPHLWSSEEGLKSLENNISKDTSEKIGIIILTHNGQYILSNLWPEKFQLAWAIMNVKGEVVSSNFAFLDKTFVQHDPMVAEKIMKM